MNLFEFFKNIYLVEHLQTAASWLTNRILDPTKYLISEKKAGFKLDQLKF